MTLLVPHFFFEIHDDPATKRQMRPKSEEPTNKACEELDKPRNILHAHDVVAFMKPFDVLTPAVFCNVVDKKLLRSKVVPSSDAC